MSLYDGDFLRRQSSRRIDAVQVAFRHLSRSKSPKHKESHGSTAQMGNKMSPLAKEANIFKEFVYEALVSESAVKRWRELDNSDDSSPGEQDRLDVVTPYNRIVCRTDPLRRSLSPRSRPFCQPVFEEEVEIPKDKEAQKQHNVINNRSNTTRDNSILSQLLNNPIRETQRKRRNEPLARATNSKIQRSRTPVGNARDKSVKDQRAVNAKPFGGYQPLQARDINSQTYTQKLEASLSNSKHVSKGKLSDYEVGKLIAKGSYSLVKHGMRIIDKAPVAIKVYDHSKLIDMQKRMGVDREVNALKKLDHPNIIGMVDSFSTRMQTCIVMEQVGTCTLYKYVKSHLENRLSCQESSVIFSQLVDAVAYMHSNDVCHRDLKLENIILEGMSRVKIIDFGFSTDNTTKQRTFCGTPTYMAPEITKRKDYLGYQVDNWAMGVILFRLITGTYPFSAKTDRDLFSKICQGKVDLSLIPDADAQACIADLLDVNPDTRVTCEEVISAYSASKLSLLDQIRQIG